MCNSNIITQTSLMQLNIKTFLNGETRRDKQNLSEQNLPERRRVPRRTKPF
jgi:hypothetical protein